MENSLISWCDHTQNFWIGCTHVSQGCAMCYADTLDLNRFSKTLGGGTKNAPVRHWGKGAPRHRTSISIWNNPLRWDRMAKAGHFAEVTRNGQFVARGDLRKLAKEKVGGAWLIQPGDTVIKVRPRVFCSSLSDILDPEVDPKMLAEALDEIRKCDGIDWLLLTKRPDLWRERMMAALDYKQRTESIATIQDSWLVAWLDGRAPTNVWFGTTTEDQPRADKRISALLAIPARIRFISAEPLIAPLDLAYACFNGTDSFGTMPGIHWVIAGGESGDDVKDCAGKVIRSPRPMHPDWPRQLREQCAIAGVAFHFKQWGAWREPANIAEEEASVWVGLDGTVYKDVTEVPDTSRASMMFRDGRKAPGRLLDGVEHNAFPKASCPNDTDGDGDCHLCHRSGGCTQKEVRR